MSSGCIFHPVRGGIDSPFLGLMTVFQRWSFNDPPPRRWPPATKDPVENLVICGFNAAFTLKGLEEVTSESVTAAGSHPLTRHT